MHNTQKDRYEHKLLRFLREVSAQHKAYCADNNTFSISQFQQIYDVLQKQYGLTEKDIQKAYALRKHKSDKVFYCDNINEYKTEHKQKIFDKVDKQELYEDF